MIPAFIKKLNYPSNFEQAEDHMHEKKIKLAFAPI
jgi:hypothetical protein